MKKPLLSMRQNVAALLFGVIFLPSMANAQWSQRIKLSSNSVAAQLNESMGQDLVANGDTLHVVWWDQHNAGSAIYYKRSDDAGLTWTENVAITDTTGHATFPSVAVSGSTVHVVWFDSLGNFSASFYKRSLDGGNTWGPNICIDSVTTFWPGVWASGSLVVASLNNLVAPGNTEVFFRRSLDNGTTWNTIQQISNADGRSEDPAIRVLGADVHLAWNDNRNGYMETYYRHSADSGVTWGPETELINPGHNYASYSTMISLNGQHVDIPSGDNQNGNYNVWLRQSADTGSSWDTAHQVTYNASDESYPYIIRDSNNLYMVYLQINNGEGPWYTHSADGGATWDTSLSFGFGGQPFIAITGCKLHVIYPDSGSIYYVNSSINNCSAVTAIVNSTGQEDVTVYPNPSAGNWYLAVNIELIGSKLLLFDDEGRLVFQSEIGNLKSEITAAGLPGGVYYLQLSSANVSIVRKLVKL